MSKAVRPLGTAAHPRFTYMLLGSVCVPSSLGKRGDNQMRKKTKFISAKGMNEFVGLAGEYAVASELCKRGFYAQLTLGNHKKQIFLLRAERKYLEFQ